MDHTRQRPFSFEKLDLWRLALDAVGMAHEIADQLGRPYGALADQLRRASASIGANIAEGVGKEGADQLRYFRIARGSVYETAALVEMAARIGRVTAEQRDQIRQPLLSVAKIITTLLLRR